MLSTDRKKLGLWLIGIGLLVRLLLFFVFYTHVTIFPDSSGYVELAQKIMDWDLSGYFGGRSPGYPLLIALVGGNLYLVLGLQGIIGLVTSWYWYRSFLALGYSTKSSFYVSLVLSTLLNMLFFETAILAESTVLSLMSIVVYRIVSGYFERYDFKEELLMGFLLGLLTLIKPFYAFLPFLIYALYILKKGSFKDVLGKKLLIFILPLTCYFGWSYVNKINTGYFVSSTFFGLNMSQNCVRFAEKGPERYQWIMDPYVEYREKSIREQRDLAMSIWDAYNAGAFLSSGLDFPQLSNALGAYAWETIKKNPLDYMKQVALHSFVDFWKPTIYWNYDHFNFKYANKGFLMIWYLQSAMLTLIRLLFLILLPFTVLKSIRTKKISILFALTVLVMSAAVLQAMVTYGTNDRFGFPFEFIMVMVVLMYLKDNAILRRPIKNIKTRIYAL